MSNQFISEIRIFGGGYAPQGWAMCNGQLLPISQNSSLYALIGTHYGGDGITTFALPNLSGGTPMQQGQGVGLSPRTLGQTGGSDQITLATSQIPSHNHQLNSVNDVGDSNQPSKLSMARSTGGAIYNADDAGGLATFNPFAVSVDGGGQPHNNMQPFLALNFIIALEGIMPTRP